MYIYIYMTSVNISLKEEAYERLVSLKKPDESFSDEILRITEKKTTEGLKDAFGLLKDSISGEDAKEMERFIKNMRRKTSDILKKWGS